MIYNEQYQAVNKSFIFTLVLVFFNEVQCMALLKTFSRDNMSWINVNLQMQDDQRTLSYKY